MVSDPGARTEQGHLSSAHIDFRLSKSVVHPNVQYFGALSLQPCGLRVRALRLTACMLAVLRLKAKITPRPPRTRYPAAANLTGAGFPPARLHDLARPHWTFLSEAKHTFVPKGPPNVFVDLHSPKSCFSVLRVIEYTPNVPSRRSALCLGQECPRSSCAATPSERHRGGEPVSITAGTAVPPCLLTRRDALGGWHGRLACVFSAQSFMRLRVTHRG